MKNLRNTLLCTLALLITSITLNAQLIQTNNFGIYPTANPFFNPDGQFASIGESGGTTQPINGCDLYGFRSQLDVNNSINVGMQPSILQPIPPNPQIMIPTILWESRANSRLAFQQRNALNSPFFLGCGRTLVSIGQVSSNPYVMYVSGTAFATGGWAQNSDLRLKENIKGISDPMDIISKLNGVTYNYTPDQAPNKLLPTGKNYGFVAQEVQKVLPDIINKDDDGFLAMKYDAIIPILTEAVKVQQEFIADQDLIIAEQDEKIDNLEARLAKIEQLLTATQSRSEEETTISTLTTKGVTLKQNRPNPFSTSTTIEYQLPKTITSASLVVYDMYGKQVKNYAITSNAGTVELDASSLSNGTYIYAIEANGQSLAREKMIIQK